MIDDEVVSRRLSRLERLEPRQLFSSATDLLDDIDGDAPPATMQKAAQVAMPLSAPVAIAAAAAPSSETAQFPSKFVPVDSAPTARFEGYNFVLRGLLWSVGGFDADFKTVPGVDIYNPNTGKWATRSDVRLKAAETHAGVAIDGKYVYFAGGFVGDLLPGRQQPISNTVWRWEPLADKWKRVASLPEGRGGGALVKLGRELHYFGGTISDRVTNSGSHWVLQLGQTTSAVDDGTHWVPKRSLPKARDHLSGVAVDGMVYAIGGEFGHDVQSLQTGYVHRFDPTTNTWTRVASLPIAKSHTESAAFAMGEKIIVAGGQVAGRGPTADVEEYDSASNTWTQVKSLPEARQGAAIQKLDNQIVVALGAVQTTEPQTEAWVGKVRIV